MTWGHVHNLALRVLELAKMDCENLAINPFVYSENHIAESDYSIKTLCNSKNQTTQTKKKERKTGLSTQSLCPHYFFSLKCSWIKCLSQERVYIMIDFRSYKYPRSEAYEGWKFSIHTSVTETAVALNREDNLCKFQTVESWSRLCCQLLWREIY